jgi:hypothetical protein
MKRTPSDQARREGLFDAASGRVRNNAPRKGMLVLDTATQRTGVVMSLATEKLEYGSRRVAYLRPVGGGIEWTANIEAICQAEGGSNG